MKTLVVGIGALGGLIAARLQAAGSPVRLATRTQESAERLRTSGLRVTGLGSAVQVDAPGVASTDEYQPTDAFDLIVLATKAREAVEVAPRLASLLAPAGTLLPIQNGGVARAIADRLRDRRVLGGLSNLGATMVAPGVYAQRNTGHLLIGELAGGVSPRAKRVGDWLGRAVEVRVTPNIQGAVWSKLLLNCSVTTIGAVAGLTLREYLGAPAGRALFEATYDEALAVAMAAGAHAGRGGASAQARPRVRGLARGGPPGLRRRQALDAPGFRAWTPDGDRLHQRLRRRLRAPERRAGTVERRNRGNGTSHLARSAHSRPGAAGAGAEGCRRFPPVVSFGRRTFEMAGGAGARGYLWFLEGDARASWAIVRRGTQRREGEKV
jgi:2-dehydropantoate 2-reductase